MKPMTTNMNPYKLRKDIAIQTDSASEYSSETDGSDESETNYSGFDSNLISSSSKMSTTSQAMQSTIIELTDLNNEDTKDKGANISSHNLPTCEVNSTSSPSMDKIRIQLQGQKTNMIVKSNSQQVYYNSSVDTQNISASNNNNIKNSDNLTGCYKRNSSASLDSGRDSTYATGSEGSSGVHCIQQYSDDGCILSPTLQYCHNNQVSKNNNTVPLSKVDHNFSGCPSFDRPLLPIAAIPPICIHNTLASYNASNCCSSSNSRNYSCQQLKQYQQQVNKDDNLISPTHKYNSGNTDHRFVNPIATVAESFEYFFHHQHFPSSENTKNCCSTTNFNQSSYSPCQEKNCTGLNCSLTKIPINLCSQLQFPPSIITQQPTLGHHHKQHQPIHSVVISPDDEALFAWLRSVGLSRLSGCLSKSGFDLWTLCHTTPEELNACGITNPYDRLMLRNQLNSLQLSDPFTEKKLPHLSITTVVGAYLCIMGHQKKFITAIGKLNRLLHDHIVPSSGMNCATTGLLNCSVNKQLYPTTTVTRNDETFSQSPNSFHRKCNLSQHPPNQYSNVSGDMVKDKGSCQETSKRNISEIGIQVEENITKSSAAPSSPTFSSSSTTSNLSSNDSPYSLPPPIGFQDSPPTESSPSTFLTISLIHNSEHSNSDLQQSNSTCIVSEQVAPNLSASNFINTGDTHSSRPLCNISNPINVDNTLLLGTNHASERYNHPQYQKEEHQMDIFRRRSSNPTLYSPKPIDAVQNAGDLSKWSSGFFTTPQLRLPVNVNSTSDPDLEAMHNIQVMLDQLSERLIVTNK
ncbi:Caskin-2 [Schistosoma japonicum]|nr:Caskin-2 [Schistosoma japonicum]KAH8874095.1 Caskin-2 [Schistosoma japonicum]